MPLKEKVLLLVHFEGLKRVAQKDTGDTVAAQALIETILAAMPNYDRVVGFEHDPWKPEWDLKRAEYSYDEIARSLLGSEVTIAGFQKDMCVGKVCDELRSRSVDVSVGEGLAINSVYLR